MFFVVALALPLSIVFVGGLLAWLYGGPLRRAWSAVTDLVRPRTEASIGWFVDRAGGRPGTVLWLVATLAGFIGVTWIAGSAVAVASDATGALPGEPRLLQALLDSRTAGRTVAMRWLTTLGDFFAAVAVVTVVGVTWRLRRGGWAALGYLVVAYGGGLVAYNAVKVAVRRERPPDPFTFSDAAGSAFPSGHTVQAAAVYTAVAILLAAVMARWGARVAVGAVAAALVAVVAVTRLYLGAHWPSDVVASVPVGAGWALLAWWCASSRVTPDALTVDVPAHPTAADADAC